MARIAGINIPPHKHAEIGLTSIYGIGRSTAQKICEAVGIPLSKKIKDLNDSELEKIRDEIGKITIEGDLRREIAILALQHVEMQIKMLGQRCGVRLLVGGDLRLEGIDLRGKTLGLLLEEFGRIRRACRP
ncbi:MAG: 30S ribosomal protein S13 [Aquincola sp.]|nr:30S ribosomal protein S13 [Aquincola sp.]